MQRQSYQWPRLTLGVCYYPEHWPRSLWREDLCRMKAAGITVLRAAEFAWSLLEPREGEFCFDFFDEFLALCEEVEMRVILGTPTAAPPAWLTEGYPEVLNACQDGTLLRHGARRHYTYNSPVYQRLCARIVEQMARRYGPHPAVVGWQIDNELNCETDEFYAEADHAAFRRFVREKYGSLEALNEAWGAVFWSETYTDWSQIHCPRPVLNGGHNPHLLLDYARFVSESCLSFAAMQAGILRKYKKPGDFITTNGLFGNLDNHRLQNEVLDVYTYDSYPDFAFELGKPLTELKDRNWSRKLIETRSVCPHFGIMEQQSGGGGWVNRMEMPAPRPGQLTLWALQSVAHGADFISFFRWRTAVFGTELYWHGILDYDNRDNRKLREVRDFGRLLERLEPVCGARHTAAFALLKDYDNEWDARLDAFHRRFHRHSEAEIFTASQLSHTPYDAVYLRDETQPEELAGYPVVIYPHPVILTRARAELLRRYVAQGGTLILGCRAGLKDDRGQAVMLPQPGLLAELTGTDVRDFTFVSPNEPQDPDTPVWNDVLTPLEGTQVLDTYKTGYYAGAPCLTEHLLGKGRVLHLGSAFSRGRTVQLLERCGILAPFSGEVSAPEGVELVMREKEGRRFLFALNYQTEQQTLTLHRPATLLYTGETQEGTVTLPPFGTAVYELSR